MNRIIRHWGHYSAATKAELLATAALLLMWGAIAGALIAPCL